MRLFYGVGFNDKSRPAKDLTRNAPIYHYNIWKKMLRRCYDLDFHVLQPSYTNCHISENFKSYSYFYDWCEKQIGFGEHNFELDKDILKKGNKIYSEETCVFIPKEINQLFATCGKARGEYPIGVHYDHFTRRLKAAIRYKGRSVNLGRFDDPVVAFNAYKKTKEEIIREHAEKWKDHIDPRAYNALMQYTVEITD